MNDSNHFPLIFSKYTGAGNDFVLFDDRECLFPLTDSNFLSSLCHRHLGIGADGIILLQNSLLDQVDYRMRIFNADGNEAEMCGNGIRCLARFISDLGEHSTSFSIETMERCLRVKLINDLVCVEMGIIQNIAWDQTYSLDGNDYLFQSLNTGVPHTLTFTTDLSKAPLQHWAQQLQQHADFQDNGVNVNLAHINTAREISMRTYERGVETETLACGTGAVAVAIAASRQYSLKPPIFVRVSSGDQLQINWSEKFKNVTMIGPAFCIFKGTLSKVPKLHI